MHRSPRRSRNSTIHSENAGFTLLEMLITVAILVILLTFSTASFRGIVTGGQVDSASDDLLHLFQYARTTAITNKTTVKVCNYTKSGDSYVCNSTTDWAGDIIVFVDQFNPIASQAPNNTCDNCDLSAAAADAAGVFREQLLRLHPAPGEHVSITATDPVYGWESTGTSTVTTAKTIEIRPKDGGESVHSMEISIETSGRIGARQI